MERKRRRPMIAALLSVLFPGLGQIYNGQAGKGIVFYLCNLIPLPVLSLTGLLHNFYGMVISLVLMGSLYVFIIGHAFFTAKKAGEMILKTYNKSYYYMAFIIFVLIIVFASDAEFVKDSFGVRAYKIPSASMEPALMIGDHVIVEQRPDEIKRGDIIVFLVPVDRKKDYIKRVVGLEGDTVELKNEKVFVNGAEWEDPFGVYKGGIYGKNNEATNNFGPFTVPKKSIFVLGDNRDRSYDSRYWGTVPMDDIKGKALYIYFSKDLSRISKSLN